MSMRIYQMSSVIFPRSLHLRLFSLCFVATHLPLISFIVAQGTGGHLDIGDTVLLTSATLAGTVLSIGGIWALLAPVRTAARALSDLEEGRLPNVPSVKSKDIVAELLAGVHRAANATEQRTKSLDAAAHRDPLTGVYNRRGLIGRLESYPQSDRSGTLTLLDLDFLKQVNDELGHAEGDRVLRDFAARIGSETRKQDLIARWGGDEFAIFFPNTAEEDALSVLHRVARAMVSSPIAVLEKGLATFSAGTTETSGEPLEKAMHRADAALYSAKRGGRALIVSSAQIADLL